MKTEEKESYSSKGRRDAKETEARTVVDPTMYRQVYLSLSK